MENTTLIIIGFVTLFFRETIINFVKSTFSIKTQKTIQLSEYKLQRYDEFVDKIEAMLSGDEKERKRANETLNRLWGKMLLSAPDEVVRKFIEETKKEEGQKFRKFNKEERNRLYLIMRRELQPGTDLRLEEIENIYFETKK